MKNKNKFQGVVMHTKVITEEAKFHNLQSN